MLVSSVIFTKHEQVSYEIRDAIVVYNMINANAETTSFEFPERTITVDQERVDYVLGKLVTAHAANEYPYSLETTRVPQDHRHLPESLEIGSVDHAMFLWTSCYYMRGGIKSVDAFKRLSNMYGAVPELFVPAETRGVAAEHIAELLKAHGLGFQSTVSKAWVENARRLDDKWSGNPINIYHDVSDYEAAVERIKNTRGKGFIGFQEKMVSMITYYLMDESLIDEFQFPLPVDLHVMRITIANELLKFDGYQEDENLLSSETLAVVRQLYFDYAVRNNVSTLRLCDAVWLLSEALCGKQPGNITLEPNGRENRRGRTTLLLPLPIKPSSQAQREQYHKSCGSCPIESSCAWNIPGKNYYVSGEVVRRGRRMKLPLPDQQETLFE